VSSSDPRPLGIVDVASVVIGAIIGVGIFFTPSVVASVAPSGAGMLFAWALGGVVAGLGALVLADLSTILPEAGGMYVFLREGFGRYGRWVAYLYGVVNLLVVQPAACAIIAAVLVLNLEVLVGDMGPAGRTAAAVAALVGFAAINAAGLKTGARVQRATAGLKVLAVAALAGLGVGFAGTAGPPGPAPQAEASWLAAAMIPVMFSYGGWQHGSYVAGVARNPRRTVPIGIIAGVVIVVICYLSANAAYLSLLGHQGMATSTALAADAGTAALGPVAGKVLAGVIVISAAGILNTILLAFPWVVVAMSRDGTLPATLGAIHPTRGAPHLAIGLMCAVAVAGVFVGGETLDRLLAATSFGDWAFFALVGIAHLRLMARRAPDATFRVGRWAPALFTLAAGAITLGTCYVKPVETAYGVGILVLATGWWILRRGR